VDTITWQIVKIAQNSFDDKPSDHPKAQYIYELEADTSPGWRSGSSIEYADVQLVMAHFKVNHPQKLAGKTFESSSREHSRALELFLFHIRTNGTYWPPSAENIRILVAVALSQMSEPNLSHIDHRSIANAFKEVWGKGFTADPTWLGQFAALIFDLSSGQVLLTPAGDVEFNLLFNGQASNMLLTKGDKTIRVILGPYSNPVTFDSGQTL
jgi:hypothetical protein